MGKYVDYYCSDNNKELKKLVNPILMNHFRWLPSQYYDDFYSILAQVVWDCEKSFNEQKVKTNKFKSYLLSCINNKIKSQLTHMHRDKRCLKDDEGNPIYEISLDTPVGDDEKVTIGDIIQSDFDIDIVLSERDDSYYSEKIIEYLDSLPEKSKAVAKLIMKGYEACDIQDILKMTDKQYKDCWNVITSYDKKRILYSETNNVEEKKMNTVIVEENVTEKYKNTSYSIDSISKQLRKKKIRDDHILQRHSGQWKSFAKSELISDILRGKSLTQIIISEEIKNGIKMQWLIDGKQRCTTIDDYYHDGFPISKNVKNYNITYPVSNLDEDGNEILNEEGFPIPKYETCDIRGKKFSQLPEELQDIFRDRQIPVLYNTNCTKKDIADDIARFNRSRPMNKAQNGWLELEESFAEFVENIAKMQFFQPEFSGSSYTENSTTSGAIRRIIVESIMISDFIDDFGDFDKMCEFLSEEASDSNFTEFYSLVERLTVICNTKNIAKLFSVKDSFLWFGLFSKFTKLRIDDNKFVDFMNNFETLRSEKIDGVSFDDILILAGKKSTKNKGIIIKKFNHLEKLMYQYFDIQKNQRETEIEEDKIQEIEIDFDDTDDSDIVVATENESFIADVLNMDLNEVSENMDIYNEDLDCLTDKTIRDGSKLLDNANRKSLLAMLVYAYERDVSLEKWLEHYAAKNNMYFPDQRKNFLYMKKDFINYIETKERVS